MATHSSILAWEIPCTQKLGRLQSMGVTNSQTRLSDFYFHFHFSVEGTWVPSPVRELKSHMPQGN